MEGGVEDPGGVDTTPRHNPGHREYDKDDITGSLKRIWDLIQYLYMAARWGRYHTGSQSRSQRI